jgi:hypothetical protein
MTPIPMRLACIILLSIAAAAPCMAESFASSASSAGSASVGSLSDSVKGSSKSSSGETKVADGDYLVIEVAELAGRPGMLQLKLQATTQPGDAGQVWLTLPQQALDRQGLAPGDVVSARQRPYGLEFARERTRESAAGREAFFLVLADDWYRELEARALTL